MKFWNSYGSEHSANLVMIGHFKSNTDAQEAQEAIEKIKEHLTRTDETYEDAERFTQPMLDVLRDLKVYSLQPREISQFTYDVSTKLKDDKIVITTDESDFSAFLKILIEYSAKVKVYSAHDYTETGEGR
ncbi:hypothetical protein GCM10023091_00170 [Ravibacter arvi]|uniref:Uncharacterized protein n=1 Tax=Ravibacter arvi TaxID=2051041 RepID=A0ABP8LLM0_9BACT